LPSNNPSITTFIYIALPCEAKPLIEFYRLKKDLSVTYFSIYTNNTICLTVTGIGKTAIAAGIAYSQARYSTQSQPVMLNVGIVGHQLYALGELFLADKITDIDTGKQYYPPITFTPDCATAKLHTFSKPQSVYPQAALCDMEGAAFYETATRFATGELCHCLKIISDNAASPSDNINPQQVTGLIGGQLPGINNVMLALRQLAQELQPQFIAEYEQLLGKYHFTANEKIQLNKLLSRWRLIIPLAEASLSDITAHNAKDFLKNLEQAVNTVKFDLS
jgi:adenosylhomocysteine nucleosidase